MKGTVLACASIPIEAVLDDVRRQGTISGGRAPTNRSTASNVNRLLNPVNAGAHVQADLTNAEALRGFYLLPANSLSTSLSFWLNSAGLSSMG
jgi:hypothetical protein